MTTLMMMGHITDEHFTRKDTGLFSYCLTRVSNVYPVMVCEKYKN